ncbi:hypothetical protein A5655_07085 [Mycobacterium sp. 1081908.1]|nr:hypothetical protein A5655_07085 [Mycobacterium sp. 1081908.1]
MTPRPASLSTPFGPVHCSCLEPQDVYRVGYKPEPWNWTPWEYADEGRFSGRWDDPAGIWRTLYLGSSELACYLEVLAPFRPDGELAAELAEIVEEEGDEGSVPPGELDRSWCDERLVCSGRFSGSYALPAHPETLSTLRKRRDFLRLAKACGCSDLDASAIRDGKRELTQAISAWIYTKTGTAGQPADGIEYQSRHGDYLPLWAVYERDTGHAWPPQVTDRDARPITPDDPSLLEAMRLHNIEWDEE